MRRGPVEPGSLGIRLAWFVVLWCGGVAALAAIAAVIRWALA